MINLIYENLFVLLLSSSVCECAAHRLRFIFLLLIPQQSSLIDKDLYSGTKTNVKNVSFNYFDVKATLAPKL